MHIGDRIKKRRKQLGMTQEDLAFISNISQGAISRYEAGTNEPTADKIVEIAKALDCSTDYLLGITDFPARPIEGFEDLNDEEVNLLELYRSKAPEDRHKLFEIARVV